MSDSWRLHGLYSPWNSPGQNTGVGSLSLLQGIFPVQGSNPGLRQSRWILYQLSHKEAQEYWSGYQCSRYGFNPWSGKIPHATGSSSSCCFLTCIQISHEAGQVVWYSHLFKNFPVCFDPHSQGFGIVNKAEVDVFLELSSFSMIQQMLAI